MATKVTKELLAFRLANDVNIAVWKVKPSQFNGNYADDLAALLMTIALCAKLAKKDTPDGREAGWQIAQMIALCIRDPAYVRDHFTRCVKTGFEMYSNIKPDDEAHDQAQLNSFALRALKLHNVGERIRQMMCQFQEDSTLRCYSPISWKRRWPWVSENIFGHPVN